MISYFYASFNHLNHIYTFFNTSYNTINTQIYKSSVFDKTINLIFLPPLVKVVPNFRRPVSENGKLSENFDKSTPRKDH
jgi:hypothetical protein